MGGSASFDKSDSSSDFNQNIWSGQQQPLMDMYGNAQALYQGQDYSGLQNQADWASNYGQNIAQGSTGGWENQMSGGFQDDALRNSIMQSMQNPSAMGQMYESIVGGAGNTYIDPMVEAQNQAIQEQYDRYGKPSADMAAENAGQSGSARHGVSQFLGQNQANMDQLRNEMNLRGQAYDTDMDWKMQIAQQADLGRGDAQDRAMSLLNSQNQNQQSALGAGTGMQQLGSNTMSPQIDMNQLPWQNLMQYAQALGAPTVLGSGGSDASSWGHSAGASIKG